MMSKSILVIETPNSCSDCGLSDCDVQFRSVLYTCPLVKGIDEYAHSNEVHPQCPLEEA